MIIPAEAIVTCMQSHMAIGVVCTCVCVNVVVITATLVNITVIKTMSLSYTCGEIVVVSCRECNS